MSNTSTIHIKTDFDCKVYDYGQELGTTKADIYFNIELRKGEHELSFVFTENESISKTINYTAEDVDCEYKLVVEIAEKLCKKAKEYYNSKDYLKAYSLFSLAAEKGLAEAQCRLGNLFTTGEGVEKNEKKSEEWYLKAIEQGNTEAQVGLADLYARHAKWSQGIGEPHPELLIKSFWLYYQAAVKGNLYAQYAIGDCFDWGHGISPNKAKAIEWYITAAEHGSINAQLLLGHYYEFGYLHYKDEYPSCGEIESIQDYEKAKKWYTMAAKQDSIDGCLALGYFYLNSKENFNFNDAEFWFLKALDLGSIDAQFSLGELYFKVFSHEVEELENSYGYHISYEDFFADYGSNNIYLEESIGWYHRAANNGCKKALYELGRCNQIEGNSEEAFRWFQKAAESEITDAQLELGNCYRDGIGIERNYDKALEWYEKAAKSWNSIHLGRAKAQFELGNCYYLGHEQGWNVDVDINKAFSWYLKAAEGGLKCAQYTIEVCYRKGIGIAKNVQLASQWKEKKEKNAIDPFDIDSYNISDGGFLWESNPIVYEYLQELEESLPHYTQKPISKLGQKAISQEYKIGQTTIAPLKKTLLFFDTETTGMPRDYCAPTSNSTNWPRLVQLSWITTDEDCNILSENDYIIHPDGFTIPEDAVRLHGITTEIAKEKGKPIKEVIDKFMEDFNAATTIVGHNIDFDKKIIGAELIRLGQKDIMDNKPSLCTMEASTDYCKIPGSYGYKWPKLQELHKKLFGCEFEDAHNSMSDVKATLKCFKEMKRLEWI
jgi:TPR repeat protein/DNA polymerase III epsilon subunit-like protein